MNSTTRALSAVAAAALLAACGGDGKSPSREARPAASQGGVQGGSDVKAGPPGAVPSAGAPVPGAHGTAAPAPGATSVPGKSAGPAATGAPAPSASATTKSPEELKASHVPINIVLAKSCVRPGETQTVSFRARPNMRVVGNTGYADRQDGTVHGGRFNNVNTDETGYFTTTWTVSPTAPHGQASVQVAVVDQHGTGTDKKSFTVAAVC